MIVVQSKLLVGPDPDCKKKEQDRDLTVGRDSVQYTVHMYTKPEFGVR